LWGDYFYLVPQGVDSLDFTWTLTKLHVTSTWEYFLLTHNNTLLAWFNYENAMPPPTVEHMVPLNQHTGRQTILARWNISDTPNSFYSCVDLLIDPTMAVVDAAAMQRLISMPLAVPGLGYCTVTTNSSSIWYFFVAEMSEKFSFDLR